MQIPQAASQLCSKKMLLCCRRQTTASQLPGVDCQCYIGSAVVAYTMTEVDTEDQLRERKNTIFGRYRSAYTINTSGARTCERFSLRQDRAIRSAGSDMSRECGCMIGPRLRLGGRDRALGTNKSGLDTPPEFLGTERNESSSRGGQPGLSSSQLPPPADSAGAPSSNGVHCLFVDLIRHSSPYHFRDNQY